MTAVLSRGWVWRRLGGGDRRAVTFVAFRMGQYGVLFLCGLISARQLGPTGRALYALPLALGSTIWLLTHFSLDAAAARLFARRETDLESLIRARATGILISGVAGALAAIAIGLGAKRLVGGAALTDVVLGAATVPLWLWVSAGGNFLLLLDRTARYGAVSLVASLAQLLMLLVIIADTGLTPALALLTVVAGLFANGAGFTWLLAREVGWRALRPSGDLRLLRRQLRVGVQLHPAAIGLALSLQIDLFCIAQLGTRAQVGLYSVAATLAANLFLAITAAAQSALPSQMQHDEAAAARYTAGFARRSTILTLAVAGIGIATAYPLIRILYGAPWTSSVVPYVILVLASVPLMLQTPTSVFLTRSASPMLFAGVGLAAIVLNVALNVALIPALSISGCALASLVTYTIYSAILVTVFRRTTGVRIFKLW